MAEAALTAALRLRRSAVSTPALLLSALVLLGALVAAGAVTPLDQYAVDHLMPGLYPYVDGGRHVPVAWPWNPQRIVNRVADDVILPATPVVAAVLLVTALALAGPRVRRGAWLAGFAAVVLAELAGKELIARPPLLTNAAYGSVHVVKFDHSFPSGHAARAILLAGLVATRWPRLGAAALAWAAIVALLLAAAGTHTPSDVAGGVLLGAAAATLCRRSAA